MYLVWSMGLLVPNENILLSNFNINFGSLRSN